ncbi:MAG: bifunctional DNA-binding transcriptional regulator/O6-methylguanine-DNA methyltransferase Ada [Candidatus Eremiobacteraeota bacterium]|nr:bifunctional DNA-binding transcriptional regulator/O6-methylguanine-DNA methyltransferase Ada [Candidatus Eremiobacteraeota bacterium]
MQLLQSNSTLNSDGRLAAVMARDRRADGAFVYGVTSTGIFCRPSCASRRPRRDRIALFASADKAREAGFRPCRRCQPESVAASTNIAQRICRYIDEQQDDAPTLGELSARFGLSPHHLARSFKAAIGMTPKAYGDLQRVERLKTRLQSGQSVTTALYSAGYGSSSRLYEQGSALLGMKPSDYRRLGLGTSVTFTVVGTTLGKLLVASTERGICAVKLGDSSAALERALRHEYSAARVQRDDAGLTTVVGQIVRHIEAGAPLAQLATDVAATAFTRSVWKALAAIPSGQTRTYGQIAASIGRPTAARAVARACATNQLALIIPCHRVVPSSGGSGGYRWGAARKRTLLERERRASPQKVSR